jgi:hypothetical protein
MTSLRKFQGALPRLLALRAAVGDGAMRCASSAPLTEMPTLLCTMISRTRTFTSAAQWEDRRPVDPPGEEALDAEELDAEDTVLTLPTDLRMLTSINPELVKVMQAHNAHAR